MFGNPGSTELPMLAEASCGQAVLTDPVAALTMLAGEVPVAERALPTPNPRPEPVDLAGRPLTAAAAYATITGVLPSVGVLVCESVSNMRDCQDQIRFSRPGSYHSPARVSLGFGVPAAIGVQLADPDRPVVAVVGGGALQYAGPALWSAARCQVPLTVVALRNDRYAVLEDYCGFLGGHGGAGVAGARHRHRAADPGLRRAGGTADGADALAAALRDGLARPGPTLIEVPVGGCAETHW